MNLAKNWFGADRCWPSASFKRLVVGADRLVPASPPPALVCFNEGGPELLRTPRQRVIIKPEGGKY